MEKMAILALMIVVQVAGAAGSLQTGNTVITSKRLDFDYKRYIAVFEEDVVVVDPQVRMESDRLNVVFDGTNSVKSVVASGNVRLWHEGKTAACQRAVYVARTGEVVLRGNAVLTRGEDRVSGDEITVWLFEDRMTCTPGSLVIGPQTAGTSGGSPLGSAVRRTPAAKPRQSGTATGQGLRATPARP